MKLETKEFLMNILMLIGFLMFLGGVFFITYEIGTAIMNCDGDYGLKLVENDIKHTCNGEIFVKYTDGWRIYQNISINYTDLVTNHPQE